MSGDGRSPARARTLTEALKRLDGDALTELLTLRPDLAYPLPYDTAELASRAATTTSTGRALELLNVWLRTVAEALAALPDPTCAPAVANLLDVGVPETREALAELRRRAVLWGDDDQLHLVRGVREYFEPYPGGLAPPSSRPLSGAQISGALAGCDDSVRPLLERLLWSPAGAVRNADRRLDVAGARSPVEQLLARGLLRPLDSDTVLLPREVALQLRGGRFTPLPVSPYPPASNGRTRRPELVDQSAAGAAFSMLHDVELVAHLLETSQHRLLRTGGLGARDLTQLARLLAADPAQTGFVLEVAAIAGLVAAGAGSSLLPTANYDRWADRDAAERWRMLATAWLRGGRHYFRSSEPAAHVLGPEADAPGAPLLRRLVLELLVAAGQGVVLDAAQLTEAVAWHYPRAARTEAALATLVASLRREAGWLGVTGLEAVSSYAAALLDDGPLPPALVELFPAPVNKIVVQADLTAVAPGPLPYALAADVRLLADQESRGGAGVYRFSAGSLRRAFEAGWSSEQVHGWLQRHSATGVPQPLAYVIDDVARQYGSIRVGSAVSYLRVDDPAAVAALLARPEAPTLGLRALAPGVLVSTAEAPELVRFLRACGHAPAVEDENGSTLVAPPRPRAPGPLANPAPRPLTPAEAAAAIVAVERRQRAPGRTEETLRELELAAEEAGSLRVRYVAADGQPAERDLAPLDVRAGMMRARDTVAAEVISIPLARISSVWPVPEAH